MGLACLAVVLPGRALGGAVRRLLREPGLVGAQALLARVRAGVTDADGQQRGRRRRTGRRPGAGRGAPRWPRGTGPGGRGSAARAAAASRVCTRWAETSAGDGIATSVRVARVVRSIWRRRDCSDGVTNDSASPSRPARPVRPMRCTYVSGSRGTSKLTTSPMRSTSRPRAATSVATRTSRRPCAAGRRSSRARSGRRHRRCRRGDAALDQRAADLLGRAAGADEHDRRVGAATGQHPGERTGLVAVRDDGVGLPDARHRGRLARDRDLDRAVQVLLGDRRICGGIVAENRATCRSRGGRHRTLSTSSAKPMRSISSASSSTRKRTLSA